MQSYFKHAQSGSYEYGVLREQYGGTGIDDVGQSGYVLTSDGVNFFMAPGGSGLSGISGNSQSGWSGISGTGTASAAQKQFTWFLM